MRYLQRFKEAKSAEMVKWSLWALAAACVAVQRPVAYPDSSGYMQHAIDRTPLYPLVLDLVRLISGAPQSRVLVIIQAAAGMFAAATLGKGLRERFGLKDIGEGAVVLLLFGPQLDWAANVLTESLTYSLFLVGCASLLTYCYASGRRELVRACVAFVLAMLCRPQFTFVLPVLGAAFVGLAWLRRSVRQAALAVGILVATAAAGTVVQSTYSLLLHGHFGQVPSTGIQLATLALFVSDSNSTQFDDPRVAELAIPVLKDMEAKQLYEGSLGACDSVCKLTSRYNDICWGVLVLEYHRLVGHDALTDSEWVDLDRRTLKLAWGLIAQHKRSFVHIIARQILRSVGTGFALLLGIGAVTVLQAVRRSGPAWVFLGAMVGFVIANDTLIATLETFMFRYTLAADTAFTAVVLSMLSGGVSKLGAVGASAA